MAWPFSSGLTVSVADLPSPPDPVPVQITAEAGVSAAWEDDFRVEPLVKEDDVVAQGQPVFRSRRHAQIVLTAPMPARIARIGMGAGRRLSQLVFFLEQGAGRHQFDIDANVLGTDAQALRSALQVSGLWRQLGTRPFGPDPLPDEEPAAIFVMALDTRPGAPDPELAINGRLADLERGLLALTHLTSGPVYFCQKHGTDLVFGRGISDRLRTIKSDAIHPWGLAGFQIHRNHPATPQRRVWDIHAEAVADIGSFLLTGLVPETRLVSISGPALREPRYVRCQPGADLRGLSYGLVKPGRHSILTGSALGGHDARWLGQRDRQTTVLTGAIDSGRRHWFLSALKGAARPLPVIPTAAIDQALGGEVPAVALLRAVAAGDTETAAQLGLLSFVPEDMALIDYVTCAEPRYAHLLQVLIGRIKQEEAA